MDHIGSKAFFLTAGAGSRDGATWKVNSENKGTGATHPPWPSDGWRKRAWGSRTAASICVHSPSEWCVDQIVVLGNKYFPKWAVYSRGASLTAWALYCLMTRVIHFRCNIKCPCAFCTPLFHGVSDWIGDNKFNGARINGDYLISLRILRVFCSFQLGGFTLSMEPEERGDSQDSSQVNLSNLVDVGGFFF